MNAVKVEVQLNGESFRGARAPDPEGIEMWTTQQIAAFQAAKEKADESRAGLDHGVRLLFDAILRNAGKLGEPAGYRLTVTLEPAGETYDAV